jgi:hypothetical protein
VQKAVQHGVAKRAGAAGDEQDSTAEHSR